MGQGCTPPYIVPGTTCIRCFIFVKVSSIGSVTQDVLLSLRVTDPWRSRAYVFVSGSLDIEWQRSKLS
jgi:hypothetical protein